MFMACGADPGAEQGGKQPEPGDAATDGPRRDLPVEDASVPDAPLPDSSARCGDVVMSLSELRVRSRDELRAFFGLPEAFADGSLHFRELATGVDQCPSFDQSQIVYAASVPESVYPLELRALVPAERRRVYLTWGLNGYEYVLFGDQGADPTNPLPRAGDLYPVSACTTVTNPTSVERAAEIAAEMQAASSLVPVRHLDAIGVLCWGPDVDDPQSTVLTGADHSYYRDVQAIADIVRSHDDELGTIEWSPMTFGIETQEAPAREVAADPLDPDCLRTFTANPALAHRSLPSFPPPFGAGWRDNPEPRCD